VDSWAKSIILVKHRKKMAITNRERFTDLLWTAMPPVSAQATWRGTFLKLGYGSDYGYTFLKASTALALLKGISLDFC
jgi:hypothetical protein